MKIQKRGKMILLFTIPFVLIVIVLIMMQMDTNSIMHEVKEAFYCSDFYVEESFYAPDEYPEKYADPDVNYIVYKYDPDKPNINAHFNITSHSIDTKHLDDLNIDLKLKQIFTWHNFCKGTLWIKYTIKVTDENGDLLVGSYRIPVIMSIQKNDGKWEVTDIYEHP